MSDSKDRPFLFKQFAIHQSHAAMKVGTDSDLLGALAAGGSRLLDVGTGTGVLSLMMAQRFPQAQITAIEIDEGAVVDAQRNFAESRFADRIALQHVSFQDYLLQASPSAFDSIVCNPPYFDRSLECPERGRTRARHTSSLPFDVLLAGTYSLLCDGGLFSVCIPPEVLDVFLALSQQTGYTLHTLYKIKTIPTKSPKRFVLVLQKGGDGVTQEFEYCMRNEDRTRSEWYLDLMEDFLLCGSL